MDSARHFRFVAFRHACPRKKHTAPGISQIHPNAGSKLIHAIATTAQPAATTYITVPHARRNLLFAAACFSVTFPELRIASRVRSQLCALRSAFFSKPFTPS